jgi:hypothetical protein
MRIIYCFWLLFLASCQGEKHCPSRFAPNFTKQNFSRIRAGMDSNEVIHLLGQPIWKLDKRVDRFVAADTINKNKFHIWRYSDDTSTLYDMDCWYLYGVNFDSLGVVIDTFVRIIND